MPRQPFPQPKSSTNGTADPPTVPAEQALIYCKVHGSPGTEADQETISECLTKAIPTITPINVGSPNSSEIVYSNHAGRGILHKLQDVEARITKQGEIIISQKGDVTALNEKLAGQEKIITNQRENIATLKKKSTILGPMEGIAIGIRNRFFAMSRRGAGLDGIGIGSSIRKGNNIAHDRDVVTDLCLLENGLIAYHQTFKQLYGLDWRTATELIGHPHIISIMNHRATILHDYPSWNRQKEFDELITWTKIADDDALAKFAADETGWTWARRKFFLVMGGGP